MSETNKMRIVTDDEETTLLEGVSSILSVVRSMGGDTKDLPATFENCGERDKGAVLVRCLEALAAKQNDRDRGVLRTARGIVDGVIGDARTNALKAYQVVADLLSKTPDALRPIVEKSMGDAAQPPTTAHVSINEVRHAYPEGMSDEGIVALLHRSNYSLVKGKSKDGTPRINVKITPEDVKAFLDAQ